MMSVFHDELSIFDMHHGETVYLQQPVACLLLACPAGRDGVHQDPLFQLCDQTGAAGHA